MLATSPCDLLGAIAICRSVFTIKSSEGEDPEAPTVRVMNKLRIAIHTRGPYSPGLY